MISNTMGVKWKGLDKWHQSFRSPPESVPRDKVQTVRLDMRLNRQSLYKTFDALGNLAGKTGEIRVIVEANSADGIERNWLRNAVKEPLEEAGIEIDITES